MREKIKVEVVNGYLRIIHEEGEVTLYEEDAFPLISLILDAVAANSKEDKSNCNLTTTTQC